MGASTNFEPAFSFTHFATSRDVVGSMVETSMNSLELSVGGFGSDDARTSSKTPLT